MERETGFEPATSSLESHTEHKGAELLPNLTRRQTMARQMNPTAGELDETLAEIADLAEEALDPELK